jgi:hypothetical protein
MASSSITSSGPWYIAITRMDEEVMLGIILVDFASLHMRNAVIAANEMKDFIATLTGLPRSQVKHQIAQLHEQACTKATTITKIRDRNSALMKEGRDLVENKTNWDKELALTQQRVKDLEERAPTCTHGDLQTKITELEQQLTSRIPTDQDEVRQELEDAREQYTIIGEERNEFQDHVKRVLVLADTGGSNHGEKEHNGSAILRFSGTDRRAHRGWIGQLLLKIADEPKRFTNNQKKMRYAANQLEVIALNQIQPYIDRTSGVLKLDSLDKLLDLLQLAFGDQDI